MAFITFHTQKKPLICFVVTAMLTAGLITLTILLGYKNNGIYHTNTSQYHEVFNFLNRIPGLTFKSIIDFHSSANFNFNSFSVLSVIATCYKVLFNVSNTHLHLYLFWQQVITYCIILGCALTGFFYERLKQGNLWVTLIIGLVTIFTVLFTFIFYESPIVGNSWIMPIIIIYCTIYFSNNALPEDQRNNLFLLIMFTFAALDINLIIIDTFLLVLTFYSSSLRNLNPFGSLLYFFFPYALLLFLWIPFASQVLYAILIGISLMAFIIVVVLYSYKRINMTVRIFNMG
ncbi:MAG: hypothetical protein LBV37_01615, partial [Mycoplasmataceae bacterium]|nr:hypothetical protein [Mycoplasmataceae bacterium]